MRRISKWHIPFALFIMESGPMPTFSLLGGCREQGICTSSCAVHALSACQALSDSALDSLPSSRSCTRGFVTSCYRDNCRGRWDPCSGPTRVRGTHLELRNHWQLCSKVRVTRAHEELGRPRNAPLRDCPSLLLFEAEQSSFARDMSTVKLPQCATEAQRAFFAATTSWSQQQSSLATLSIDEPPCHIHISPQQRPVLQLLPRARSSHDHGRISAFEMKLTPLTTDTCISA